MSGSRGGTGTEDVSSGSATAAAIRAGEDRLAWLATLARDLHAERIPGERPPTWALPLPDGRPFAIFGVIDATYFWTFDSGESMHYAKDGAVMQRLLKFELAKAAA
jgi:hypothetical protein